MTDITDYDYNLPERLIASNPADKRDCSRLLVLDKETGGITLHKFNQIKNHLCAGDLLILNNTRVFPARLVGKRKSGSDVEVLLCENIKDKKWQILAKKVDEGERLDFSGGLKMEIVKKNGREILADFNIVGDEFWKIINKYGKTPLPPYIAKNDNLPEEFHRRRYQTVYAEKTGSIAAPTAGLHFTPNLIDELKRSGVNIEYLTLHVGMGTFLPVKTSLDKHKMHHEKYSISKDLLEKIVDAKSKKRRVIAVGTTTTRVLETIFLQKDISSLLKFDKKEISGSTNLFIKEGFNFKAIDGLVTNFHLPKSTLLILVSAFAGKEKIMKSYKEAIKNDFRFFSYGDSMLII